MTKNPNKLYVFVKGNKDIGAFVITGPDFSEIHKDTVDGAGKASTHQLYMDLLAMEASLEYIANRRGEYPITEQPVVCIYTTFENNYEVLIPGPTKPREDAMVAMKQKLDNLKDTINQGRKKPDGVKYLWIPNDIERHLERIMDDVQQLISDHKNETKVRPR